MMERDAQRDLEWLAFETWCQRQQARVRQILRQAEERVNRARWGDPNGEGAHLVVSRKGWTTEASGPIERQFQDQDMREAIRQL